MVQEAPLSTRKSPSALTRVDEPVVAPSIRSDDPVIEEFQYRSLIGLGSVLAQRICSGSGNGLKSCVKFLRDEVSDKAGFNKYDREVMLWAAARSLIERTVGPSATVLSTDEAAEAWQTMLKLVAEAGKGGVPLVADAHQAIATAFEQSWAGGLDLSPLHRIAARLIGDFRTLYLCVLVQRTATPILPQVRRWGEVG